MDRTQTYIVHSLENHLFFARIMKEHAFFLKVGFLPPNGDLAKESEFLLRRFEALLSRAISLSNCIVRCRVLESGELFTDFTGKAEQQTQHLTGTFLDRRLTAREQQLKCRERCGDPPISQGLPGQVRQLNRDGLQLVDRLIALKERILRNVLSCRLFTSNYPLLIEHILREARLYRSHLLMLEGKEPEGSQEPLDGEVFWNQIMMEHALFIRGLLDPTEEALIHTADDFAANYRRLLAANSRAMGGGVQMLTEKFRDFKQAGVEGIEGCQIRSIILPLLADHVLREANHYLRLLGE